MFLHLKNKTKQNKNCRLALKIRFNIKKTWQ